MFQILSYISLRNLIPVVRLNYSNLFTWIGYISLEVRANKPINQTKSPNKVSPNKVSPNKVSPNPPVAFSQLCVTQCHMWLSGDTHGVLVLIPGDTKILNVVVTTFVFVCTSHQLHAISNTLNEYLIPNDNRLLLRNAILFAAVLFPIAISNGLIL